MKKKIKAGESTIKDILSNENAPKPGEKDTDSDESD